SLSDPPLYLLLLPSFPTRRSSDLTFVCFINCFRLISWFRLFFVTAIVLSLVSIVIILTVSGIIAVLAVFRTVVFLAVIILTAIGFVTIPRPITVIRFFLRRLFLRWFFSVLSSSDLLIIFSCFSYIAMNIRNFQFNKFICCSFALGHDRCCYNIVSIFIDFNCRQRCRLSISRVPHFLEYCSYFRNFGFI